MSINYNEYINKIIEIGKKELCTSQDLDYFLTNLPDVGNRELRDALQRDFKIDTWHLTSDELFTFNRKINEQPLSDAQKKNISFLTNLIKGCHLIEIRYGGFGSTTNICNLFGSLIEADVNKAIDLHNWIAFNGGNWYITPNSARPNNEEAKEYVQWRKKRRLEELLNDQKIRSEAIARRKNKLYLHTKKSNETRRLYKECKEMFQKMDDKQLVKTFNKEAGKLGWLSSKRYFFSAMHKEFENRKYDYSIIGNKKGLFCAKKIKLVGNKIVENTRKK